MNTAPHTPSVSLIGCGRWGRNIAKSLARLGALKTIIDPAVDALAPFAAELGVTVLPDIESALADPDIVAVAIAVPAVDHAQVASRALAAGKHVFVEKPLALEIEDAERLAAQAEEAGLTLMVGHLLQYHPAFVRLVEMVQSGEIGDLRHVTSNRLNPGAIRTEENALWSMAPHDFSMVLALAGSEPERVEALAVRVIDPTVPDEYSVQLRFQNITALVRASWLSPFKEHKLVALGTTGALVFEDTAADPDRKLVIYRDYVDQSGSAPRFNKTAGEPVAYPADEPLMAELSWFLDSVAGKKTPRTGPAEAIPVLKLLAAASRAAA